MELSHHNLIFWAIAYLLIISLFIVFRLIRKKSPEEDMEEALDIEEELLINRILAREAGELSKECMRKNDPEGALSWNKYQEMILLESDEMIDKAQKQLRKAYKF